MTGPVSIGHESDQESNADTTAAPQLCDDCGSRVDDHRFATCIRCFYGIARFRPGGAMHRPRGGTS